jgi:hypothetical protein
MEINEPVVEGRQRKCCHTCFVALRPDNLTQVCYHREKYIWGNALNYKEQLKFDESLPDYEREYSAEKISEMMKIGRENGFFVTYNHPAWSFETFPEYTSYRNMNAMEIVNYGCFNAGYNDYAPQVYDEMLRNGCGKIYCVATDDNHNAHPKDTPHWDSLGGFVMIKAPELTYKSIIEALKAGNFYASSAPQIHELYIEDNFLHIETSPAARITLTSSARQSKAVYPANAHTALTHAKFDLSNMCSGYVRLTVVDEKGRKAWTQPIWDDFSGIK